MARISQYERSICLSDVHAPYQDDVAIATACRFIKWYKPHNIFLLGDIIDFYSISSFMKDPEKMDLQEESDQAKIFFSSIRGVAPKANIVMTLGNHCNRLDKYLWLHPELRKMRMFQSISNLLDLEKFKIKCLDRKDRLIYNNIKLEHGDVVRKHSAYSAKAQMEKRGMTGISGHTHRLGSHYLKNESGFYAWYENGCLCDLDPEYVDEPNWQQGFTVINHSRTGDRFDINQICITDGKLSFMGKEF